MPELEDSDCWCSMREKTSVLPRGGVAIYLRKGLGGCKAPFPPLEAELESEQVWVTFRFRGVATTVGVVYVSNTLYLKEAEKQERLFATVLERIDWHAVGVRKSLFWGTLMPTGVKMISSPHQKQMSEANC